MFRFICRGWKCEPYEKQCLDSIQSQTLRDFDVFCIKDDPFGTGDRKGVCYNMYHGIHNCGAQDEDILCFVDLDDYLLAPDVLEKLTRAYQKHPETLVTYGSYINSETKQIGRICKPYPKNVDVRSFRWRGSHLKTMKFKVAKLIPAEYFQHEGRWGGAASDLALMFSAIEITGLNRCHFISRPLYYYRANTAITLNRGTQKKWAKIFRAKKPLEKIF